MNPTAETPRSAKALGAFSSKVASYLMATVASIVISRELGPAGRGTYFVLVTIASTAITVGHLSVEQAHVFMWSKSTQRRSLSANALVIGFALGLVAAAVAWAIVTALGQDTVPVAGGKLLFVALAAVPIGVVALYSNGLLVLEDRIGRVNIGILLATVLQTAAIISMSLAGELTVEAVIIIWALTTLVPLFVTLPSVRPRLKNFSIEIAKRAVGLGARYHLGMISVFLLFRSDVFILNALVSRTQVGLYSLAVTIAELIFLLTDPIAQVMLPRQVSASMEDAATVTARTIRTNFLISLAVVASMIVTGPFLIPFVFGKAFGGSVPPLAALGVGVLALATLRPVGGYLIRLDRPLLIAASSLGALAANIGLNFALIPVWGIVGAGVASTVAYVALAGFQLGWFIRASGLPISQLIPRWSDVKDPLASLLSYRPGGLP